MPSGTAMAEAMLLEVREMAVSDETFYPQRHEDEHVRLNVPDLRSSAAAARGPAAAAGK